MLVSCRKCGLGFDHKLGRCVACGAEIETTSEERVALLAEEVASRMRGGERRGVIRGALAADSRLGEIEIDDVMKRAAATLKWEARSHAKHLVTSGFVLLGVAVFVYLIPFPFGRLIFAGSLAVGAAMIVLGEFKMITGWNITSRDDG